MRACKIRSSTIRHIQVVAGDNLLVFKQLIGGDGGRYRRGITVDKWSPLGGKNEALHLSWMKGS